MERGREENIRSEKIREWFFRYGKNVSLLIDSVKVLRTKTSEPNLVLDAAELQYAIEHEMIAHPADLLIRRTGKIFFDRINTEKQLEHLNSLLSQELHIESNSSQKNLAEVKEEFEAAVSFE